MHTKDVLGLGEGHSISLLELALFAYRMATVAPVADKELRGRVGRESQTSPN